MQTTLSLTLALLDGNIVMIECFPTETLRSILLRASITAPYNTTILCFHKNDRLSLDLSMQVQLISNNDIIVVLFQKANSKQLIFPKTDHRSNAREIYSELMRISDLESLSSDTTKLRAKIPNSISSAQEKLMSNSSELIVLQTSPDIIPNQPLPICWDASLPEDEGITIPQATLAGSFQEW